jgi:hypothetical protein
MYAEFSGTITSDQEFQAFHPAFHVDGAKRKAPPYPDQRALTIAANASNGLEVAGRVGTALPACVDLNLTLLVGAIAPC